VSRVVSQLCSPPCLLNSNGMWGLLLHLGWRVRKLRGPTDGDNNIGVSKFTCVCMWLYIQRCQSICVSLAFVVLRLDAVICMVDVWCELQLSADYRLYAFSMMPLNVSGIPSFWACIYTMQRCRHSGVIVDYVVSRRALVIFLIVYNSGVLQSGDTALSDHCTSGMMPVLCAATHRCWCQAHQCEQGSWQLH